MDVMFSIPSDPTISECIITAGAIEGESEPVIIYRDRSIMARSTA